MSRYLLVCAITAFISGCQTAPAHNVHVGSSYPAGNCREVGQVIGNAATRENARSQALNDLRYNAAQRDANYVRVVAETAYGTAIRGIAYRCR